MSAAQIAEWEAYYRLEPFGNDWQQTALLAHLIANANRDAEQRPEPFRLEEFLPFHLDEEYELVSPDESVDEGDNESDAEISSQPEPEWMSWKQKMELMVEATK